MYNPSHFHITDSAVLQDLIRQHPLGCLVAQTADGLDANHLPFELLQDEDGQLRLLAHVARANPLWQQLGNGAAVLVIFKAQDGYISPNWYPSKHEHHKLVPTWNYRVVHIHGTVRLHDDKKWVLAAIGKLTRTHEQRTHHALPHAAGPWKIKDTPPEHLESLIANIVGIEIAVQRVEAKFKLSQNRSQADMHSAATQVSAAGNPALGTAMGQP